MTIGEGDMLPDATLIAGDGTPLALAEMRGRPLVLFFYPKADTPGCTREASDFSALSDDFARAGIGVVGVSRDAPARLTRFAAKHDLTITLASDAGPLSDAFGFWGEKKLYGRSFMGMERATVLIDADGRVARIWRKVRVADHAGEVLAAARRIA